MNDHPLRRLPKVDVLLGHPRVQALVDRYSRRRVTQAVRRFLDHLRQQVLHEGAAVPEQDQLLEQLEHHVEKQCRNPLRVVINATGVLLHTGLGRSPLASAAVQALAHCGAHYASVELDLETGRRSQRVLAVSSLLEELTGAEAAVVVNNNAGATLITLAALARGREVVVSRGQLVEIGGSFRLPEVMEVSGARLREVGTTNKTRLSDYQRAIGPRTAALLRVHTSNFRIVGFTQEVPLDELVALGRRYQLPVIDDIGSGVLVPLDIPELEQEPVASRSVAQGADLVLFSGDKLLGGPQCGIIVGRRRWVQRIARHPLMRALRVDKLTLSALAATLELYLDMEQAREQLPLLRMLHAPLETLRRRAQRLARRLQQQVPALEPRAVRDVGYFGGGSVPTQQLPTWCVALSPREGSLARLAWALRTGEMPVVARVQKERLLLDLRTVFPNQDHTLADAVAKAWQRLGLQAESR